MSGLFKVQDPVFTLGDEDPEDLDPADFTPVEKGMNKAPAATSQSAIDKEQEDASLPVSSAAGATQGSLNGLNSTLQVLSDATGQDAIKEAKSGEDTMVLMQPSSQLQTSKSRFKPSTLTQQQRRRHRRYLLLRVQLQKALAVSLRMAQHR